MESPIQIQQLRYGVTDALGEIVLYARHHEGLADEDVTLLAQADLGVGDPVEGALGGLDTRRLAAVVQLGPGRASSLMPARTVPLDCARAKVSRGSCGRPQPPASTATSISERTVPTTVGSPHRPARSYWEEASGAYQAGLPAVAGVASKGTTGASDQRRSRS